MPSKAVQTDDAPKKRPANPCRICEMQLRIQWLFTVHSLLNIWVFRLWGPRSRNKTFWGIVSVVAVVGLHRISDKPYYCRGRRFRGRHFWGRAAEGGMEIVQCANDGARRLAAWFRERRSSSTSSDNMEDTGDTPEVKPEVKPEALKPEFKPEVKSEVRPKVKPEVRPKVRAEPEVEDDYDLCELD